VAPAAGEVLHYPGVPPRFSALELETLRTPVLPITFRLGHQIFRYFSAVTVLGTAQDITLRRAASRKPRAGAPPRMLLSIRCRDGL
jgi:hypothetical protein